MPIEPLGTTILIEVLKDYMGVKLGSIVMVLMVFFIAKVSFETAMAEKNPETKAVNDRSPASIDQSYHDHLNKK